MPFPIPNRLRSLALLAGLALWAAGCAHHKPLPPVETTRWYAAAPAPDDRIRRYAPVFEVPGADRPFNRIGQVTARRTPSGAVDIRVDPSRAVVYTSQSDFETANGPYTNLIYRIHFSAVPFSLVPFNLTAGRNVGVMVVVTLNDREQPVLVSTVHTCGCYLAMVPTTHLPPRAHPPDWPEREQDVYGERLPARLSFPPEGGRLVVTLRPEVHRVMALAVLPDSALQHRIRPSDAMDMAPLDALERLPLDGGPVSFYHREGVLKGHVRGSVKPLETLLMSLISLDLFVGADKAFADTDRTGNPFYTSLKPWNRRASDMWHFSRFLQFWGWGL
jgi:hypothetical protein